MKINNHISPVVGDANRRSERGIALVITLILLSVTLVMAVAFLAISRRERGSVTTSTDTVTARLAADAALANAQAQIIASILATNTAAYAPSLIVSTNFINPYGFVSGNSYPTNVNYFYAGGGPLSSVADFEQNVANLLYLPRAPVFVTTNQQSGASDFRFYLDLNRNGQFEDTGPAVTNYDNGNNILFVGGKAVTNYQVGDPQWVGVLERPDVTHGPNNKFISRYAFVAMPADGSLDLNAIYNQAVTRTVSPANNTPDGYFRNQGVGSWEINLAAFLADLNTNQWNPPTVENSLIEPYQYPATVGGSVAFEDARALLSYRYANNYNSLALASAMFPNNSLASGPVDIFPFGPTMANTATPNYSLPNLNYSWAGADNTNHYFALASDLFTAAKVENNVTPPGFIERLNQASNNNSTYDRYTFYRLLAQLGTDSAPAQNQINLNYSNAAAYFNNNGILTNVVYFPNAQTNLVPWQPLQFFTITADRLLKEYSTRWFQSDPTNYLITYYGITPTYYVDGSGFGVTNAQYAGQRLTNQIPFFGITNIPVLENGRFCYTPAVQRVLQLAANIYDATTNQATVYGRDYPSVFRPVLYKSVIGSVTNVTIVGYQYITSVTAIPGQQYLPPIDPPDYILGNVNSLKLGFTPPNPRVTTDAYGNVWGVPWIIGAKKGLPNFNEFSMQDVVRVTRKLQVTRPDTNSPPSATNQMYVFSVTNSLGVEFWNSYTNGYTNLSANIQVVVNDNPSMRLMLSNGTTLYADGRTLATPATQNLQSNYFLNVWPAKTFEVPFDANFAFLSNSAYLFSSPQFYYVGDNPNPTFQKTTPALPPLPQMVLQVTNYLQAFILDGNHVLDYVHFIGPGSSRNLNSEFQNTNTTVIGGDTAPYYTSLIWSTALDNTNIPIGIDTQVGISAGTIGLNNTYWPNTQLTHDQIDGFRHFLNPNYASLYGTTTNFMYSTNLAVQVPYTPTAVTYEYDTYQANDPLVHYLKSDLSFFGADGNSGVQTGVHQPATNSPTLSILPNLGKVNARYMPWGTNFPTGEIDANGLPASTLNVDQNPYNLAYKDPLMTRPDNWDFPTNKLPTVGWLGRVHRGTPWQTVYLKASDVLPETINVGQRVLSIGTNTWALFTGDANHFDAVNSAPVQDRLLFDNFSTALNDNATRGQLSVNMGANNRPSLAAWSAVLSGVVALTNTTALPQYKPLTNGWLTINPAGPAGNSSVVGQLVTNINTMRAQFKNPDGLTGVFEHVGDILSTPQLTEQSPFLNTNNTAQGGQQLQYGISDEVYEWLPQQMLSLLRVPGTPQSPMRYVIYSYGQTLQPAPNGVVTGGPNLANGTSPFGMVTNYQVVAETATRAVVRVNQVLATNRDGTVSTNYSTKIEQFNVLPPD
jgi:hypothetical protein